MPQTTFIKTEYENQSVLGATKDDGIILCEWYVGLTADLQEKGLLSEFKRMELLN